MKLPATLVIEYKATIKTTGHGLQTENLKKSVYNQFSVSQYAFLSFRKNSVLVKILSYGRNFDALS